MTLSLFDTTPLSAFARAECLDILQARFLGTARWTAEVQDEIRRGVTMHHRLDAVLRGDWLGEPIRLTDPADLAAIERTRWALGGTDARPERHRGEAASLVAAERMQAAVVVDDRDARRLAVARGIRIIGTEGILRGSAQDEELTWDEAWELFQQMRRLGFRLRDLTRAQFEAG